MIRTPTMICAVAATLSVAGDAGARVEWPSPTWFVHNAAIVGTGVVESVSAETNGDGNRCAQIVTSSSFRGDATPGMHLRACYAGPTASRYEWGVGPNIVAGEEVLYFATEAREGDLVLAHPYVGLVQEATFQTTRWDARGSYGEYRSTVQTAVTFVDASTDEQRGRVALEIVDGDNLYSWEFLAAELRGGDLELPRSPPRFDASSLMPRLAQRFRETSGQLRVVVFRTLGELDQVRALNGRFSNDVLDAALALMEAPEVEARELASAEARRRTSVMQFVDHGPTCWPDGGQNPACFERRWGEDFGYRPEGPPDERERALDRWRAWWAENRGEGAYDSSDARIAERAAQEARLPAEQAAAERRLGEVVARDVIAGFKTLDPDDPLTNTRIRYIRAAGYEVTPDGRVVAQGVDASSDVDVLEVGDGADAEGETSEVDAGEATSARRGCGCAVPDTSPGGLWVLAATLGGLTFRRARSASRKSSWIAPAVSRTAPDAASNADRLTRRPTCAVCSASQRGGRRWLGATRSWRRRQSEAV
jgi:MYXO-CTERM domain-containing protein